ncbi:hypothetical protein ACYDLZ_06460 [Staphylococcus succinus]
MKQTLRIEYAVEKDGLYYNDQNDTVKWFGTPFYMNSVFVLEEQAIKVAEKYISTVKKFRVIAEVEDKQND